MPSAHGHSQYHAFLALGRAVTHETLSLCRQRSGGKFAGLLLESGAWSQQCRVNSADCFSVARAFTGGADGAARSTDQQVRSSSKAKDLGDGLVHRVAYEVARTITWNAGRTAVG